MVPPRADPARERGRAAAFAIRHERALGVLGAIWFALGCADAAGFIDLPRIPLLTGTAGLVAAGIANALWWGWLRPMIERAR